MSTWDLVMKENNNNEEVKFVKLPVGTTVLRVLDDEPKAMWKHWVKNANGGKGISVVCIGNGCPICEENKQAKNSGLKPIHSTTMSFAMNVLTNDGEVQILEKGKTIFQSLYNLKTQMVAMGDLCAYKIGITRVGEKMNEISYTVLPQFPPVSLEDECKEKSLEVDDVLSKKVDLSDYYKPLTREQITKLMNGASLVDVTSNAEEETASNDVDFTID